MLADRGNRFWLAGAVFAAAVAVAGFGPTYYLKTWFATPALTQLVHAHAAIFTTWLVVFGTQATLVSANRVDLHRKLGVLAIAVIVAMIVTGTLAAIGSARAGLTAVGFDPLQFLAIPLGVLAVFTGLAVAGLVRRRDAAMHKRLMLIATLSLLTPAIARFAFVGRRPAIAMGLTVLVVLLAALWDWRARGKLHRAWVWGLAVIVLSVPARLLIAHSEAWHRIAEAMVR
jgi:hypothetical protein